MNKLTHIHDLISLGPGCIMYRNELFPDTSVTIIDGDTLLVLGECNQIDIDEDLMMQFFADSDMNLDKLLSIIYKRFCKSAPGFESSSDEEELALYHDPVFDHLKNIVTSDRKLYIYTWGKKNHKYAKPQTSQNNYNACMIGGKRRGLNLKDLDGRSEDVQKGVISGTGYYTFMEGIVKSIEKNNYNTISINCTAGRHRCVTCAIQLKKLFYPNAIIEHIDLRCIM